MNAPIAVEVAAAGAVTCVGWNLAATTAAIHAGVDNFRESQFLDEQREPLVVAAVPRWRPDDDPPLRGTPWLAQLGCRALAECLAASPASNPTVLLVAPDPLRVPDLPRLVEQLHAAWPEARTQAPHAPPRLSLSFAPTLDGARPDLLTTLAHARGLLACREAGAVVVAGVDSWLCATVIEHGLQQRLLLTTGERGGRIPGEGAGPTPDRRAPALPEHLLRQAHHQGQQDGPGPRLDDRAREESLFFRERGRRRRHPGAQEGRGLRKDRRPRVLPELGSRREGGEPRGRVQ